jgi:hypothetical protein
VQPRLARSDGVVLLALLLLLSATWIPRLTGPIDLRWDAAAYYILGTSLYQDQSYRYLNEPGEVTAVLWPPLLPAVVAVHQLVLQSTDPIVVGSALRLTYGALWVAYIAATFVFLRTLFDRWFAAFGCLLVGLHMTAIWLADRLYADLPLALAIVSSLLVMVRFPSSDWAVWLLASAAFFLRTAGAAILVAWVAHAAMQRNLHAFTRRLVLAGMPLLLWQGYIAYAERQPSYTSPPYAYARADYLLYNVSYTRNMLLRDPNRPQLGKSTLSELSSRMVGNLATAPRHLGEAVSLLEKDFATLVARAKNHPVAANFVPWRAIPLVLLTLGGLVLTGAAIHLFAGHRVLVLLLAPYLLLLSLLPTDYHWPRYLAAVAPVLVACLLTALQSVGNLSVNRPPLARRVMRCGVFAIGTAALALQAATLHWYFTHDLREVTHRFADGSATYRVFTYDAAFAAFDAGLDNLPVCAPPKDIIISSMPHWAFLRTGCLAVMPPFEPDVQLASLIELWRVS